MPKPRMTTTMWHPFANMAELGGRAVRIVRGEGCTVYDEDGRAYLDATASLWYCNVGHGRRELADAAQAQMTTLAGFHTFEAYANPAAESLCDRLAELAPMQGARVFLTAGGGSDAVDTAAKLARAYWSAAGRPDKRVILSRSFAYHGMNAYGTSLGGMAANVEPYGSLIPEVGQVPWDDASGLSTAIDLAGAERVAAFFCEPVVGAGGVLLPPPGYLERVQAICREREVLLVVDEVITGFGRLGAWFGSLRFGLVPDLLVCAKGLTSGYLPLGAVVASSRVAAPFWEAGSTRVFRHGYTYSGHPTACAVALANLGIIEREGLVARVRELERVLASALQPLRSCDLVAAVRSGVGLLAGIEIREDRRQADPALMSKLVAAARERGVITRSLAGRALQVSPPFVISEAEIGRIADVMAAVLADAA